MFSVFLKKTIAVYFNAVFWGGAILFFLGFVPFHVQEAIPTAKAQATEQLITNFGGPIVYELPCESPPGLWVIIGPPSPGSFILTTPGSFIYDYGTFIETNYVLGEATAKVDVPCIWYLPYPVEMGEGEPIIQIGTGLIYDVNKRKLIASAPWF